MFEAYVQVKTVNGDDKRNSVLLVTYDQESDWMTIRTVRGCAPLACAIFPVIRSLRLRGEPLIDFEWDETERKFRLVKPEKYKEWETGLTSRKGSTGACWAHLWKVGGDRMKERLLAFYKCSMYGKVNETIMGIPFFLAFMYAADYVRRSEDVLVKPYVWPVYYPTDDVFIEGEYSPSVHMLPQATPVTPE